MVQVYVHDSALKRGLRSKQLIKMWILGAEETLVNDREPPRFMRLGFDDAGRPWELAALVFDGGNRFLIIHAMPARKSMIQKLLRRPR